MQKHSIEINSCLTNLGQAQQKVGPDSRSGELKLITKTIHRGSGGNRERCVRRGSPCNRQLGKITPSGGKTRRHSGNIGIKNPVTSPGGGAKIDFVKDGHFIDHHRNFIRRSIPNHRDSIG